MKQITLKTLYEKITNLQRDISQIKRTLIEEPELREDFILRMRNIDLEKSIPVEDFGKRYGLKYNGLMTNYCESMSMDETLSSKECRFG